MSVQLPIGCSPVCARHNNQKNDDARRLSAAATAKKNDLEVSLSRCFYISVVYQPESRQNALSWLFKIDDTVTEKTRVKVFLLLF